MSAAEDTASARRPFIGLRPFDYGDRSFFFGRCDSVRVVESLLNQSGFVAIVGGSGTGKSSLVRAGLLPQLKADAKRRWLWATMEPGGAPIRRLACAISSLRGCEDELSDAWNERIEVCLRRSKFGIPEAVALLPEAVRSSHLVIIVDQFEELFRFANLRADSNNLSAAASLKRDEATAFVRLLLAADSIDSLRLHVLVTMRSDFIGDCARFHELPEALTRHQFLAPGLTRDQRAMAITCPIEKAFAEIDPELVQRLLNDTNEDPDQLPIIQHVMMRCWRSAADRAKGGGQIRPDADDYARIGGVANALSMHANQIFEEFSETDAKAPRSVPRELAAKRVFQALTEMDPDGRLIRRPMKLGALTKSISSFDWNEDDTRSAALSVVARLAAADCSFLRITKTDGLDDNSIVDIGHEALIRRWNKLKGEGVTDWIREEQEDGEKYRDLVRIAGARSTIPEGELPQYENWWARRKPSAAWARRYSKGGKDYFAEVGEALARSRADCEERKRLRAASAKAERDAREAQLKLATVQAQAEAESARACVAEEKAKVAAAQIAAHHQKARTLRIAAIAAGLFVCLAAPFLTAFYHSRENLRERENQLAQQSEQKQSLLVNAAESILVAQKLIGAADALALLTSSQSSDWGDAYLNEVRKALANLRETRRITTLVTPASAASDRPNIYSVSANPKKPFLVVVTAGNPPVMHFLEVRDGGRTVSRLDEMKAPIPGNRWGRGAARWSPDGERIYVAGGGANGVIVTPCAVERLRPYLERCEGKTENEIIHLGDGAQKAGFGVWSGDGNEIVTSAFQGQPVVWSASTGKVDATLEGVITNALKPERTLTSLAMSSSGRFVAEGDSKGAITILGGKSGEITARLEPKQDTLSPMQMSFNPVNDSQLLATYQGRVVLWNTETGKPEILDDRNATVMQAGFDPRGRFIFTGANDGTVRLFKLDAGGVVTEPVELRGHHGPVFAVDVAADGTIISGAGDGSVRFWQSDPVGAPGRVESFERGDVNELKNFAAQNLPYAEFGTERIRLPQQILCSVTDCPTQ